MLSMYHIFRWRKKKAEADAMRCVSGDIMARPPEPSGPGGEYECSEVCNSSRALAA